MPISAARQHQRWTIRAESNRRNWSPILSKLHHKLIEFQIEQCDLPIGQTHSNHIDGRCGLQRRHLAVKLLKREHQFAFFDVPQLQTALFAAHNDLIQIRRRMTNGRDFELFIPERDLSEFRFVYDIPHLQCAVDVDGYQMSRAEWQ